MVGIRNFVSRRGGGGGRDSVAAALVAASSACGRSRFVTFFPTYRSHCDFSHPQSAGGPRSFLPGLPENTCECICGVCSLNLSSACVKCATACRRHQQLAATFEKEKKKQTNKTRRACGRLTCGGLVSLLRWPVGLFSLGRCVCLAHLGPR